MGQSTDAILLYGVPLEAESLDDFREERYPNKDPLPDSPDFVPWLAYEGKPYDGIEIVRHCSGDYPMHIVAIEGTQTTAWRGHPKPIDVAKLAVPAGADEKLRAFVERYKLTASGEPGWWLASDWN
jgi:hypothetical protein